MAPPTPTASEPALSPARFLRLAPTRRRGGFALVITLGAIVLITILVVAFVAQSKVTRQISASQVAQIKAETVAQTALSTLLGDLREEIREGSILQETNGIVAFVPVTNSAIRPALSAGEGLANLVKRSAYQTNFFGTNGPSRAINASSGTASRNRSGISPARWNAPRLLSSTNFTVPDWCLVLRGGVPDLSTSPLPAMSELQETSPAGISGVIGRFAWMIYDEGGLLDINVAGNNLGPAENARRGRLHAADLSAIPGVGNATDLVQFRNPSPNANWLHGAANAAITIRRDLQLGETRFLTRQDLIRYATDHPAILGADSLPYLGTFSRQKNAPSWSPPANAADLGGSNGSGGLHAYKTNAESSSAANRNLANVRVKTAFLRPNGTAAEPGDLLLQQRFPLSRLAVVSDAATAGAGSNVETWFGLTRSSAAANTPWIYRNGASSLLTLDQVAQAGREPDFFELLKAAILTGSLGKHSNSNYSLITKAFDQNQDAQIIQIGANLIDQYDADNHPTCIQFGALEPVFGLENLPYLNTIYTTLFRPNRGDATYPTLEGWLQFALWNPHGNAADFTDPTKFRILGTDGKVYLESSNGTNFVSAQQDLTGRYLAFTADGTTFAEPRVLIPNTAMSGISFSGAAIDETNDPNAYFGTASQPSFATSGTSVTTASPCHLVGFYLGSLVNPVSGEPPKDRLITGIGTDPASQIYYHARAAVGPGGKYPSFDLQYLDGNNAWRTYESVQVTGIYLDHFYQSGYLSCTSWLTGRYNLQTGWGTDNKGSGPLVGTGLAYGKAALASMDPRTKRAGMVRLIALNSEVIPGNTTIRPSSGANRFDSEQLSNSGFPSNPPGLTMWHWWTTNNKFQAADLAQNKPGRSFVTDLDGITRRADGDEANKVSPLWSSNTTVSRPKILNRPFRSVGEMGYAMRGDHWKTLNFFSADSADAALLDLFSVDDAPVVAGKVNLNTRHSPVLAAVLQGALKAEEGTGSPPALSASEASAIANAIVQESSLSPLQNPAELATRIGDKLAGILSIGPTTVSDGYVKERREAAIRALAGVADTRTWNLLIDVVAQAGRYPLNAKSLDDFLVEGEKRYWLHVAIDRFTGEIIAEALEPVYE